ncbi:MAG: hypothetical protein U0R52_02725 [Solirubrobacterales bacterium]
MSGFDLLDAERGIFATAQGGGGAAVFDREAVLAAGPADGALGAELRSLRMGEVSLALEMEPAGEPLRLSGDRVPASELLLCAARGTLERGGERTAVEGSAVSIEAAEAPPGDLRRSIVIALADGGLLAVGAARPAGEAEHGGEEVVAALAAAPGEEAGAPEIAEVLLSTELDAEGRQRRATIEMWPAGEGEPAVRAGGTIVCGARIELPEARVDTAFFRWSVDGRPGLGRYEIVVPR